MKVDRRGGADDVPPDAELIVTAIERALAQP